MAIYTRGTNFAAKDNLLTGDPNKVVSGTEIDDEFQLLGVAVNSKADAVGAVLTDADINNPDIDGGTIDSAAINGGTVGASTAIESLNVDNISLDGNTISTTDTDGNLVLSPNGTGEVDISNVDIDGGAIDGTIIGANSSAAITATTATATDLVVDTDVLVVDGTTNDNVGIGTATPDAAYKLDVAGNVRATEFHGDASNVTGIEVGFAWSAATAVSGTEEDITVDSTNVTEIIVLLKGLEGSGDSTNDRWQLLLGDDGGVETNDYFNFFDGAHSGGSTDAFDLCDREGSASETYGIVKLYNPDGNDWFIEASMSHKGGSSSFGAREGATISSGFKSLSEALTTIRIKCEGGSFTAGSIYVGTKGSS